MRRFSIIVVCLLLLAACKSKSDAFVPERLLTEQEMISIMADIQIIEADINFRKINHEDVGGMAQRYYAQLFEHYGITDSVFAQNMDYYTRNPATMERIMDSVTERLLKEQATCSTQ